VPTPHRTPLYTDEQYEATKALIRHLCAQFGLDPQSPKSVVGHADIDPMKRGIVLKAGKLIGVDWDPGKLDWSRLR
jgi:N-acetyl-anhydromuramyl-L-alanine amidase AmpD